MELKKASEMTKEELKKMNEEKKSMMTCVRLLTVRDVFYKHMDCYKVLEEYGVLSDIKKTFGKYIGKVDEFSESEFVKQTPGGRRLVVGQGIGGNYRNADMFKALLEDPSNIDKAVKDYFADAMKERGVTEDQIPSAGRIPFFQALLEDFRTPSVRSVLKKAILSNENTIAEICLVFPEYLLNDDREKFSNMLSHYLAKVMTEIIEEDKLPVSLSKKAMILTYDQNDVSDLMEYAQLSKFLMEEVEEDTPALLN